VRANVSPTQFPVLAAALALLASAAQARVVDSSIDEMRERLIARYGRAGFEPAAWSSGLSADQRSNAAALLASLKDPAIRRLDAAEAQNFLNQMTSAPMSGVGHDRAAMASDGLFAAAVRVLSAPRIAATVPTVR
jgi:hypothetical protein